MQVAKTRPSSIIAAMKYITCAVVGSSMKSWGRDGVTFRDRYNNQRRVTIQDDAMRFTKMQGAGNDYVYVDCFRETVPSDVAKLAVAIADRHFGVGGDGLILIGKSERADARMRMFNADGSESEMCGNGLRCVAKYV